MKYQQMNQIKFPVKIKYIHKIDKKSSIGINVFGYKNKEKHPIYVSKKCYEDKYIDLVLIGKKDNKHYVLIKHFNTFMHDHTLYLGKNIFTILNALKLMSKKRL